MERTKGCELKAALGSENAAVLLGAHVSHVFQSGWILEPLRPVIEP